jgi:hypothetical protein
MPRFDQGTAGEQWQFLGAFNSAWAGSTENPVGKVRQRSHGAMIEVMIQVGGQLVKSIISLPTPTLWFPWHSTRLGKVGACIAGSR